MSTETMFSPGQKVTDKAGDDPASVLIVHAMTSTPANECVVRYTIDHEEFTVADFESNEQFPEDDPVVEAVYQNDLEKRVPHWENLSTDQLVEAIEAKNVRMYKFPSSRLQAL